MELDRHNLHLKTIPASSYPSNTSPLPDNHRFDTPTPLLKHPRNTILLLVEINPTVFFIVLHQLQRIRTAHRKSYFCLAQRRMLEQMKFHEFLAKFAQVLELLQVRRQRNPRKFDLQKLLVAFAISRRIKNSVDVIKNLFRCWLCAKYFFYGFNIYIPLK